MKKTLQILIKATFAFLAFLGLANRANAQCAAGEVAASFDVTTDAWGYEAYWEIVPTGNACGTGTIFSAGTTAVGCAGGGAQVAVAGAGSFPNSTTTTVGPVCLTIGVSYDLIMVDDWGDGGNHIICLGQGVDVTTNAANQTITFTAVTPAAEDLQALSTIGAEYTRIPLSQVNPAGIPLGANVRNNGTANVTDAILKVTVYSLPDTINAIKTVTSAATAIASGASVALSPGTYLPTVAGNYRVKYKVSSALITDANTLNDSILYNFSIGSDGMYARDNGDITTSLGLNGTSAGILGNVFDINVAGQQMDSVMIYVTMGAIGDTTRLLIYNVAAGLPTTQIGKSADYLSTTAATGTVLTLPVTTMAGAQLTLAPGKYFVGVYDSYIGNVGLGFTSGIYTLGGSMANINGGAFQDMGALGFSQPAVVRPFINNSTVSIKETNTIGSVAVYPNPTSGLFTINNTNGKAVNYTVSTIEGKVVKQLSNVSSSVINVDLSNENNGIYFLTVDGENTNSVFKIVKQ